VLHALAAHEMTCAEVVTHVHENTDGMVNLVYGSVYTALRALQVEGLVEPGMKRRYRLTDVGRNKARTQARALIRFSGLR
jgi:DNA-binding PadR family transcriptional regulator